MKLKQILRELFDSKAFSFTYEKTITINKERRSVNHLYNFKSNKSGLEYHANVFERSTPHNDTEAIVEFGINDEYDVLTDANEIPSILATMAAIVEDHYEKRGGKDRVAVYQYEGSDKNSEWGIDLDTQNSRQRIYDAFLKKHLPSNWKMDSHGSYTTIYPPGKHRRI